MRGLQAVQITGWGWGLPADRRRRTGWTRGRHLYRLRIKVVVVLHCVGVAPRAMAVWWCVWAQPMLPGRPRRAAAPPLPTPSHTAALRLWQGGDGGAGGEAVLI